MTLQTGRKCRWEEIEVGEVFAWHWDNNFMILCKWNSIKAFELSEDRWNVFYGGETWLSKSMKINLERDSESLYKLPLATQRLWRQDT